MAEGTSKPVGAMYVELSMDATKYTKAQKEILAGAEKNSADINRVFKTVGTQSDEMYNAMRQNIQNAYNAIAKSATSSQNEIRRAHEASAAKIKALDEQQFGAQTSMLSTLKTNWIAASVAVAGAMVAVSKAWDLVKIGAEYEEQKGILDNLSKKYGTTSDQIVDSMRRASTGLVADADLMKIALEGVGKGLNPDQLINLAGAAELLGDVVGVTTTTACTSLSASACR